MRYIIVDLEATCWDDGTDRSQMEIIEIGAVALDASDGEYRSEFSSFVRAIVEPRLSDFCRKLTTIAQQNVDEAESFPVVLERFLEWIGEEQFTLCSWGAYDLNQLRKDCARHGLPLPTTFERHINLKKEFSRKMRVPPPGMGLALRIAGLPLEGTHHRGIDDARNIAKLARLVIPELQAAL